MENLRHYTEFKINESQKTHYEYRIDVLRKEIKRSEIQLKRDMKKLRHKNYTYLSKLRKQIVELQTQIKKLD